MEKSLKKNLEECAENIIKKHQEEKRKRMSGKYSSNELVGGEPKVRVVHEAKKVYVIIFAWMQFSTELKNFFFKKYVQG